MLCGDRFLFVVSHHFINLDFLKTGDGTKLSSQKLVSKMVFRFHLKNNYNSGSFVEWLCRSKR